MAKGKKGLKNYSLLLICFCISVISWLALKMSKTYQQTYQVAVVFTNIPAEKQIFYQSDSLLTVDVKAKGIQLLPIEVRRKQLLLDYEMLMADNQKDRNYIVINKDQLTEYVKEQEKLPGEVEFKDLKNITLQLEAKQDKNK